MIQLLLLAMCLVDYVGKNRDFAKNACLGLNTSWTKLLKDIDIGVVNTYVNTYEVDMPTITATEARKNLYKLVDSVSESHVPVQITGKNNSAVLISEDDWNSIQETLYLTSMPGMRESIKNGMKTKIEYCSKSLKW